MFRLVSPVSRGTVRSTKLQKVGVRFITDVAGKVVIITGASSGIGKETAYEMAAMNAHVILACRSKSKTDPIVQDIKRVAKNERVEFMELDTASIKSVKKFVDNFKKRNLPLHTLINNAGIAGYSGVTNEGYELQMATNHLGHFMLTTSLLDVLERSAPSRIIHVSSDVYRSVKNIDYEKFIREDRSKPASLHCYAYSKFFQVAFSNKIARKMISKNAKVYSMAVHPGFIATDIWRTKGTLWKWLVSKMGSLPGKGAKGVLHCALSPYELLKNGGFYDRSKQVDATPFSNNEEIQKDVWEFSEQACENALSGKQPELFISAADKQRLEKEKEEREEKEKEEQEKQKQEKEKEGEEKEEKEKEKTK